jgi:hypothetical protein
MAKAIKKPTLVNQRTKPKARPETKQSRAVAVLRSDSGASIAAVMKVTGWQQHSVRGFLAGVVRKRLGLTLESTKVEGTRIYRIVDGRDAEPDSAADE